MTREQLVALEKLHINFPIVTSGLLLELIAQAREALELREALTTDCLIWRDDDGSYIFETGDGAFSGSTPLEAIQNARKK